LEVLKERKKLRESNKCGQELSQELIIQGFAILIGSYARGDFNLWSDIDVVLISELSCNLPRQTQENRLSTRI